VLNLPVLPLSQVVPDLVAPGAHRVVAVDGWHPEGAAPPPVAAVPSSPPSYEAAGIYPPLHGVHHQSGYHPGFASPA
jgi:hypothetical protein